MTDDEHPVLVAGGLVAAGVGLLLVFRPGLAAAIATGYAAVTLLGLLALVQFLRVARARRRSEIHLAGTDDVETVEPMPTPGDDFDRQVEELHSGPRVADVRRTNDLRETLATYAIDAIVEREHCSRDRAVEHLEAGTWTDDVHAATFLGGEEAPTPELRDRLRVAASRQSTAQFRLRRTADAIARTAGFDDGDVDGETDGAAASGSGRSGVTGRVPDSSGRERTGGSTGARRDAEPSGREPDAAASRGDT